MVPLSHNLEEALRLQTKNLFSVCDRNSRFWQNLFAKMTQTFLLPFIYATECGGKAGHKAM